MDGAGSMYPRQLAKSVLHRVSSLRSGRLRLYMHDTMTVKMMRAWVKKTISALGTLFLPKDQRGVSVDQGGVDVDAVSFAMVNEKVVSCAPLYTHGSSTEMLRAESISIMAGKRP